MAAKKLVLLSIVVVDWPVFQIGGGGGAAEIVGQRHDGAAMHDAEAVVELLAHHQFGGDALGRDMRDFQAEEFGERRLRVGRSFIATVVQLQMLQPMRGDGEIVLREIVSGGKHLIDEIGAGLPAARPRAGRAKRPAIIGSFAAGKQAASACR